MPCNFPQIILLFVQNCLYVSLCITLRKYILLNPFRSSYLVIFKEITLWALWTKLQNYVHEWKVKVDTICIFVRIIFTCHFCEISILAGTALILKDVLVTYKRFSENKRGNSDRFFKFLLLCVMLGYYTLQSSLQIQRSALLDDATCTSRSRGSFISKRTNVFECLHIICALKHNTNVHVC